MDRDADEAPEPYDGPEILERVDGPGLSWDDIEARPGRSRHDHRRRALEILFEADLKSLPPTAVLEDHLASDEPPSQFTVGIVRGVEAHVRELDVVIERRSRAWRLPRMPVVDRNLLRIGVYELLHAPEVPPAVAIDEAVELAKELSTDDSPRFVNGLLARVASDEAERAVVGEEGAPEAVPLTEAMPPDDVSGAGGAGAEAGAVAGPEAAAVGPGPTAAAEANAERPPSAYTRGATSGGTGDDVDALDPAVEGWPAEPVGDAPSPEEHSPGS